MPTNVLVVLPVALGGLAAVGCLIGAFHYLRRKRLIDDLPTSKTQGVFIGLAELKGTAESETPLTSYLAGSRCVQYAWQVKEHWSRTVHETYTDSKGHVHTRTRTESGWTLVASGGASSPFYLKDDTGIIRIVPDGATIHGVRTFDETCTRSSALYFGKGPLREVPNSDHRRHFQETAVPLHSMLYVIGQARERQDVVAAEIAYDKNAPVFLISTRTEKQVSAGYSLWYWFWLLLGLAAAAGGVGARDLLEPLSDIGWHHYALASGGFLVVLALGWIWSVYNSLTNLRQRVWQAWSQVDVQLERRNDLITNLVEVVEGYRAHESEVQRLASELRGQVKARSARPGEMEFKGLAPVLLAAVERYPELKASESFLKLQQSLGAWVTSRNKTIFRIKVLNSNPICSDISYN